MEQLQELIAHAKATGQTPTEWRMSKGVEGVIYKEEFRDLKGGPEILGLPVSFDADLPLNKIALRCGQNSAGATVLPMAVNLDAE